MFDWITTNWPEILTAASTTVAAASAIAALTPTPADDGFLAILRRLLDVLALNVGNAKR